MPFYCPICSAPHLEIQASLALPPDSRSDEIALQVVICAACGFSGLAVYEESRRGSLDSDAWDHSVYRAGAKIVSAVREAIRGCPQPGDSLCACRVHRQFTATDASGRWSGLDGYPLGESYEMRLAGKG